MKAIESSRKECTETHATRVWIGIITAGVVLSALIDTPPSSSLLPQPHFPTRKSRNSNQRSQKSNQYIPFLQPISRYPQHARVGQTRKNASSSRYLQHSCPPTRSNK